MWAYLTGKGAAINYEFVDMTVEVSLETGASSPRARAAAALARATVSDMAAQRCPG